MSRNPKLINFSARQDAFLRAEASRLGVNVSELLRRILDERIEAERERGNPVIERAVDAAAAQLLAQGAEIADAQA